MAGKTQESKTPTYLGIYNRLYTDITKGLYDEEGILPGENTLSEIYGVSRNTLRQALIILMEDGLIRRSQGKGTEIIPRIDTPTISKHLNPILTQAKNTITSIESQYNFGVPTDIAREQLKLEKSNIVLAVDSIYYSKNVSIGYSFIQIPTQVIDHLHKDLKDQKAFEDLITKDIFDICEHWDMSIKSIKANNTEAQFLSIDEKTDLLLFEVVLSNRDMLIARCKFYFIPQYFTIKLRF